MRRVVCGLIFALYAMLLAVAYMNGATLHLGPTFPPPIDEAY